jgi:hypothetical protein
MIPFFHVEPDLEYRLERRVGSSQVGQKLALGQYFFLS